MLRKQQSLEPLIFEFRNTREKLLAIGSEHVNEKQVAPLADTEASMLAKLIVANARMQSNLQDAQSRATKETPRSRTSYGRRSVGGSVKARSD